MSRPTQGDDQKTSIRFIPSSKSRSHECTSRNIQLSSSESDLHTGDHSRAVFTLKNANGTLSTLTTSEESLILGYGPHYRVSLQSSHVTLAFPYIESSLCLLRSEQRGLKICLAQRQTIVTIRETTVHASRTPVSHQILFQNVDQNQSTTLTQQTYNNRVIRTKPPP